MYIICIFIASFQLFLCCYIWSQLCLIQVFQRSLPLSGSADQTSEKKYSQYNIWTRWMYAISLCCCVSSGQRGHHWAAEVGENPSWDSGGPLRLRCAHQTPAGPAERRPAHPQWQQNRRCVREAHGWGQWGIHTLITFISSFKRKLQVFFTLDQSTQWQKNALISKVQSYCRNK